MHRLAQLLPPVAGLAVSLAAGGLLAWLTWPTALPATGRAPQLHQHHVRSLSTLDARLPPLSFDARGPLVARTGIRRLPPDWPAGWPTPADKSRFVRLVLPLVLAANEGILRERRRLQALLAAGGPRSPRERRWLALLTVRYGLPAGRSAALLEHMDTVPPSLAVAQAAIESGWGRSRFAREANALYGQWTVRRQGALRPAQARADKAGFAIRSFRHLYDSVAHYMLNLNRHPAYAGFRARRSALRAAGRSPIGRDLAPALTAYSETGADYVRLIEAVIRGGGLDRLDPPRLVPPARKSL